MLVELFDALATGKSQNRVDIQSLVGNDTGGSRYLACFQLPSHHHQDISVLALMSYPVFIFIVADGRETDVHPQFGGFEEQFLHS